MELPPDANTSDLVALHALCSRYMSYTSQFVQNRWLDVFTPDAEYNAFGTPYTLERFPALLEAAPRGQFIGNMPVVELDGDRATGVQHFVFIDQQTHAIRCHRTGPCHAEHLIRHPQPRAAKAGDCNANAKDRSIIRQGRSAAATIFDKNFGINTCFKFYRRRVTSG